MNFQEEEKMVNVQRDCLIDKWMEKKVSEMVVLHRSFVADLERKSHRHHHHREILLLNSSLSSLKSSSRPGVFSSSESKSLRRPKPIQTSVLAPPTSKKPQFGGYSWYGQHVNSAPKQQIKSSMHESGFRKTKSKVLKIYGGRHSSTISTSTTRRINIIPV